MLFYWHWEILHVCKCHLFLKKLISSLPPQKMLALSNKCCLAFSWTFCVSNYKHFPTSSTNPSSSHEPSSPRPTHPSQMTSPLPRDESSSSSPSPSSICTASPDDEDSSWPVAISKGTHSTLFSKLSPFLSFLLFFYLFIFYYYS